MPSLEEYGKDAGCKTTDDFVCRCLEMLAADPLCLAAIAAYKKQKSKKKAIAIHDVFCVQDAPLGVNADQFTKSDAVIHDYIDQLRKQHAAAGKMNIIKRVMTSKAREPDDAIFDQLELAIFGGGLSNESLLDDVARLVKAKQPLPAAWGAFRRDSVAPAVKVLTDAGFTKPELCVVGLQF